MAHIAHLFFQVFPETVEIDQVIPAQHMYLQRILVHIYAFKEPLAKPFGYFPAGKPVT